MKLTIDFETRSTVEIKKHGAFVYAAHESTDILCCAFKVDDRVAVIWMPPKARALLGHLEMSLPLLSDEGAKALINGAGVIEAHNAGFERVIWERIAAPRYGWPEIPLGKLRCSMAKCAYHALPLGLDAACSALGLPGKNKAGYALMLKMCKPARYLSTGEPVWNESPAHLLELARYCLQDAEQEHALSSLLPDLPESELVLWRLDQTINFRGVGVDFAAAASIIRGVEKWTDRLETELKKLTGGKVKTGKQVEALRKYLIKLGVELPDLKKRKVEKALKREDLTPDARSLLEIRQSLALSSVSKYQAILDRTDADDRVRGTLMYHGASTGRWSGRGIQPQNLPRGKFTDVETCIDVFQAGDVDLVDLIWSDPMTAASTCVRGVLIPSEGCDFIACDFAAIEARVNAWLAGEESSLRAFRERLELYKVAASSIFGAPYERVTKDQRQVGKVSELALGYQGGIRAYESMAEIYNVDLDAMAEFVLPTAPTDVLERAQQAAKTYFKKHKDAEISMDAALACDVVKQLWRASRPAIVDFWAGLEASCLSAVTNPGQVYECRGIKFRADGHFLRCRLPSGRCLHYFRPWIKEKKTPWGSMKAQVHYMGVGQSGKIEECHLYGGLICENVVQAVSRDLMVHAMLRLEDAGYAIVLTVHDEIVVETGAFLGGVEEVEEIMSDAPTWAAGCPVEAKAWCGKRYKKD